MKKGEMNTMVYVLDYNGTPLMPTKRHGKVRRMLNNGEAKVVKRTPFTIQLLYEPETKVVQPITLGVDAHRKAIGLSVLNIDNYEELFSAKATPRQDVKQIAKRTRQLRNQRRNRNKNRKSTKRSRGYNGKRKKPTLTTKVFANETLTMIRNTMKILPIRDINFVVAEISKRPPTEAIVNLSPRLPVDEHVMKLFGLRNYVLNRDNHICQCCFGKSKNPILTVRHIDKWFEQSRTYLFDNYHADFDSVVTLCKTCRDKYDRYERNYIAFPVSYINKTRYKTMRNHIILNHFSYLKENKMKTGRTKFKIYDKLMTDDRLFGSIHSINKVYGIDTKVLRHIYRVKYSPMNNARFAASHNPNIKKSDELYFYRFRKHHDRSLHAILPKKGGVRKPRSPKMVKGFASYDMVKYMGDKYIECRNKTFFITKKRKTGYFGIGSSDGTTILNSVKYNQLQLIKRSGTYSVELMKV